MEKSVAFCFCSFLIIGSICLGIGRARSAFADHAVETSCNITVDAHAHCVHILLFPNAGSLGATNQLYLRLQLRKRLDINLYCSVFLFYIVMCWEYCGL